MNQKFTIKSKINVKPKKRAYILKILLNVCLAVTMIAGIIKIIFDGIDIATLGTMALAIVIVSLYQKRPSANEHYEFAFVDAIINNTEINLVYHQVDSSRNNDISIMMPTSQITNLEFSDQLCCLHICGKVLCKKTGRAESVEEYNEHFLYLEKGTEQEILSAVQHAVGISVKYMDR